eukprot:694704-Rhodomonas_salina.10
MRALDTAVIVAWTRRICLTPESSSAPQNLPVNHVKAFQKSLQKPKQVCIRVPQKCPFQKRVTERFTGCVDLALDPPITTVPAHTRLNTRQPSDQCSHRFETTENGDSDSEYRFRAAWRGWLTRAQRGVGDEKQNLERIFASDAVDVGGSFRVHHLT